MFKSYRYQDEDCYTSQDDKIILQDEWYGTVIENFIRIDQNLPLRTHYGYRFGNNSWVTWPVENSRVIRPANMALDYNGFSQYFVHSGVDYRITGSFSHQLAY